MTTMPTDSATKVVEINAPLAEVLATIRDVESQAEWIPEIRGALASRRAVRAFSSPALRRRRRAVCRTSEIPPLEIAPALTV